MRNRTLSATDGKGEHQEIPEVGYQDCSQGTIDILLILQSMRQLASKGSPHWEVIAECQTVPVVIDED